MTSAAMTASRRESKEKWQANGVSHERTIAPVVVVVGGRRNDASLERKGEERTAVRVGRLEPHEGVHLSAIVEIEAEGSEDVVAVMALERGGSRQRRAGGRLGEPAAG
jgi:hypothetical protein